MTARNDKPGDLYASSRVTTSSGSKLRVVDANSDKAKMTVDILFGIFGNGKKKELKK